MSQDNIENIEDIEDIEDNNVVRKNTIPKIFDDIFNNREIMPLIPSKKMLQKYDLFIDNVSAKFLKIKENPHLINYLTDHAVHYYAHLKESKPDQYAYYKVSFDKFVESYKHFILNAVRFGKRPDKKSYKLLIKQLGLIEYLRPNGGWGSYEGIAISDIRLMYAFMNNLNRYQGYKFYKDLLYNKLYIENVYYINRFANSSNITEIRRNMFLKKMKKTKPMDSSQVSKFNEFVNIDKFSQIAAILSDVVGKYYITGSIIDYINNTALKPNEYNRSDIDIVITNRLKFELLAGFIIGYLTYAQSETSERINNIISYDGKYITLKADYFSKREIQIYYMKEKYCVFAHHFPCVRGYINTKYGMALSRQAIDIFRPDSDKKVKFVFMFPYTDVEKSKMIIKKYQARGYKIE